MSECEACDNIIIREMSMFDWDLYCDVVEEILNDILVCVILVLSICYSCTTMKNLKW